MSEDSLISSEYEQVIKDGGLCVLNTFESIAQTVGGEDIKISETNSKKRVDSMTGLLELMHKKYDFPLPETPYVYDRLVTDNQKRLLQEKKGVFERRESIIISRFLLDLCDDTDDPVGKVLSGLDKDFRHIDWDTCKDILDRGCQIALRVNPYVEGQHIFHLGMYSGKYVDYSSFEHPVIMSKENIENISKKMDSLKGWNAIIFSPPT